ncbi:hypothetical protein GCM10023187_55140 [Nibrella viscosa]|uniref:Response regulatory domain-containing protein n=1 Tax=Nibrella viscosa TaxID=1084524 RepID=A0ABP8L157_9BACT
MKNMKSILLINADETEQQKMKRACQLQGLTMVGLLTLFDFIVTAHLDLHVIDPDVLPCHIVVDLDMGYQPALDIIQAIRQHPCTCHIPITVYSQYGSACIMQRVAECGVQAFVVRPARWETLAKEIGRLVSATSDNLVLDRLRAA